MCSYSEAKSIMQNNFIGIEELRAAKEICFDINENVPEIPFSTEELETKKGDYLLILGVERFLSGDLITIRNLKRKFGMDPKDFEPCFYNQDWYEKEKFIDLPMKNEWFFIRRNVYENSRAVDPTELMKKYAFPTAIKCAYSFFVAWFVLGEKLWYHDFVWCCDVDHNGDRIYVGKYNDIDGINKNGFSIHRHLALRDTYACID